MFYLIEEDNKTNSQFCANYKSSKFDKCIAFLTITQNKK